MKYCSNCGSEVKGDLAFCTACGARIKAVSISSEPAKSPEPPRTRMESDNVKSRSKKGIWQDKRTKFVLTIVGILLIIGATYLITKEIHGGDDKAIDTSQGDIEDTDIHDGEDVSAAEGGSESYLDRVEDIQITYKGESYDLGEWDLTEVNETIYLTADDIPNDNLEQIFSLYDNGHIKPLKTWANEVYSVAQEISLNQNLPVVIEVGNQCTNLVPMTLPSSIVGYYSGSCGYSVPVLYGEDESDLTLMANISVFSSTSTATTGEYILPDSDTRELSLSDISHLKKAELRMARNEIYARNGYIFKSDNLQVYFSAKSWYIPDPYFNEGDLSKVEKSNVDLIKSLEDSMP